MILLIILEHLNVIVVLTVHVNRICMPNRFVSFVSKKKTLSFFLCECNFLYDPSVPFHNRNTSVLVGGVVLLGVYFWGADNWLFIVCFY